MKILYITPNVPQFPGTGAEAREFHLIKNLVARHEFRVICPLRRREESARRSLSEICQVQPVPLNDEYPVSLMRRASRRLSEQTSVVLKGIERFFRPPEYLMYEAFRECCLWIIGAEIDAKGFDLVEFQHSQIFPVAQPFVGKVPVVATLHNVYSAASAVSLAVSGGSSGSRHRYGNFWRRLETRILEKVDLTVTMSDIESTRCRELFPDARLKEISNGTDTTKFLPCDGKARARWELMFCGLMAYGPNVNAAQYLVKDIFPLIRGRVANCRLLLVGKDPTPEVKALAGHDVEVTGWVDDVVAYFQRCSVFIVPLRLGGGMRLKILDALACGAPVVTTSMGCEGIGLVDGKEACIRDDPQSFAEAVTDLLRHPEKGQEMGNQGRIFVEKSFDWRALAEQMDVAYGEAVLNFQRRTSEKRA